MSEEPRDPDTGQRETGPLLAVEAILNLHRPVKGDSYTLTYDQGTGRLEFWEGVKIPGDRTKRVVAVMSARDVNSGLTANQWEEARCALEAVMERPKGRRSTSDAGPACRGCSQFCPDPQIVVAHAATGAGVCQKMQKRRRATDGCPGGRRP